MACLTTSAGVIFLVCAIFLHFAALENCYSGKCQSEKRCGALFHSFIQWWWSSTAGSRWWWSYLRTAQVEVDRIALDHFGCQLNGLLEYLGIVCAKLNDQGPIFRTRRQVVAPVFRVADEIPRVKHRRVAEIGSVAPSQHSPSKFARVHHRRDNILGALQTLFVELEASKFWRHLW